MKIFSTLLLLCAALCLADCGSNNSNSGSAVATSYAMTNGVCMSNLGQQVDPSNCYNTTGYGTTGYSTTGYGTTGYGTSGYGYGPYGYGYGYGYPSGGYWPRHGGFWASIGL